MSDARRRCPRLLLVALAMTVGACGVIVPATPPPSPPAFVVEIVADGSPVGLVRDGDVLRLVVLRPDGSVNELTRALGSDERPTVHLITFGDPNLSTRSLLFGAAPPGAVRVEVRPPARTVGLAGGAYLVGLPEELLPQDIHWLFLDSAGHVLARGTGLRG